MKLVKPALSAGEKDLIFDFWTQGTGFSEISRNLVSDCKFFTVSGC